MIAACDGAAKGNPGPAAWAWVLADGGAQPQRWAAGPLGRATNNVAELTALEQLLAETDPAVPLEVRMDSTYAMKAVSTWIANWKRNGWKSSSGKPVANQELVRRIDELLTGRDVTFVHVAAHQVGGDPLNAIADQAASAAAVSQQAASGTGADAPVPSASRASAPTKTRPAGPATGGTSKAKSPKGTLPARFAGRCRCGKSYAKGEQIAKNPDGWGHPACAVAAG